MGEVMGLTIPEDKKKNVEKEKKAVEERLAVLTQFKETVDVVEKFCDDLKNFDASLKSLDSWMMSATKELEDIKNSCDKMAPEDRVARTMDLQEKVRKECDNFSEDVKYWAEYKTGINQFLP